MPVPDPIHRGIFGGTFDPIHLGHTGAARQVVTITGLDELHVIPSSVPPHRGQPVASASQRLDMVRIALASEARMVADSRELRRSGSSYTVDTVAEMRSEYPDSRFSIILGLDAALELDRWHRWRELLDMVDVLVMVRPGWSLPAKLPQWWDNATGESPPGVSTGKIHYVEITPMNVSATRIRDRLRAGEDVSEFLHPEVLDYIRKNELYVT